MTKKKGLRGAKVILYSFGFWSRDSLSATRVAGRAIGLYGAPKFGVVSSSMMPLGGVKGQK